MSLTQYQFSVSKHGLFHVIAQVLSKQGRDVVALQQCYATFEGKSGSFSKPPT